MMETIQMIVKNVLLVIYEQTGFSFVLAVLFMGSYMYAEEHGMREMLKRWVINFRTNKSFRKVFIFAFYIAMLAFHTLLNREMWLNPLEKIMGGWGLYNENGELTTEAIENVILFIPLTFLLFWSFGANVLKKGNTFWNVMVKSVVVSSGVSLVIEFSQLFFKVGTFQFSDLVYNTLGGFIGGLLYWIGNKIIQRKKKQEK